MSNNLVIWCLRVELCCQRLAGAALYFCGYMLFSDRCHCCMLVVQNFDGLPIWETYCTFVPRIVLSKNKKQFSVEELGKKPDSMMLY